LKVVDASVLIPALTDEGSTAGRAADLMTTNDLAAPELIDLEVAQALRRLVRSRVLTDARAASALNYFGSIPVVRAPHLPLLERIWAHRNNLSAYDAAYVALAEELETTLLTGDRRLASAPGIRCEIELVG